jgi:sterol desaturase/sphingolipid hydroxylase (fatty acid hydroxylase superfamily)
MDLFTLEHSKLAYRVDFVAYAVLVVVLALSLYSQSPPDALLVLGLWATAGLVSWSLMEYLLHRFVLHGMEPFRSWHTLHHQRPVALICTPTVLSAALLLGLVFLPAWMLPDGLVAMAVTLGVTLGYLGYAATHHAIHHWQPTSNWLTTRKRWHALHHRSNCQGFYGVTGKFWDRIFSSDTHPTSL